MTGFWRGWLTIWCVGLGLFGLALYGVAFPATTAPAGAIFALFGNPLPAEPNRYLRFATALMGAVTLGWAITFYAAFRAAWTLAGERARIVWRVITAAMVTWYVLDSAASLATGFPLNAASNTALLVAYLAPVLSSGALRSANSRHPDLEPGSIASLGG